MLADQPLLTYQMRNSYAAGAPSHLRQPWGTWASVIGGCLVSAGVMLLVLGSHQSRSELYTASEVTLHKPLPLSRMATNRGIDLAVARPSIVKEASSAAYNHAPSSSPATLNGTPTSSLLSIPILTAALLLAWRFVGKSKHHGTPIAMATVAGEAVEYSTIKFPPLKNDRLLRTIRGEPVDRIPVWIMRQAGRYLPEYRKFMADKEFFQVCRNPKQVAEITLQPILRYDLDASIIFSDILVIPQAMGCSITLDPAKGPVFAEPVDSRAAWNAMQDKLLQDLGIPVSPSMTSTEKNELLIQNVPKLVSPSLDYVYNAITETRMQLDGRVPLLGFCGAPMTLAIYMIEGGGSRTFAKASRLMHGDPQTAHELLTVLTHMCAHYLMNQVKAGAQTLQVFDSFAGALSPEVWHEFSYPYMTLIADLVKKEFPQMPMICFAKDAHYGIEDLSTTNYDIIALDSSVDLGDCYKRMVAKGKGVQGNIDPTVLYAPPEKITEVVSKEMQKAFGDLPSVPTKYIANMGHGMSPDHDPVHLGAFIDAIHAFGQK